MTPRERYLRACRRQQPDRVPFRVPGVARGFHPKLADFVGSDCFDGFFNHDYRWVSSMDWHQPEPVDFSVFYEEIPEHTTQTEGGIWGLIGGVAQAEHIEMPSMFHPMSTMNADPELLRRYPFPKVRWVDRSYSVHRYQELGYAVQGIAGNGLYEQCWNLRGMEQLMIDFKLNQDFAHQLLNSVADVFCESAANAARWGCDVVVFHDDVGSQKALQMSPQDWRSFIKPEYARIIDAARKVKPDVLWMYHSDGYIEDIIEDLIEIGVDILNPIQPELMDPAALKERYGDRLAFDGTISTQRTFPFGSPDDIRNEVLERIRTVGEGGGLILAPTHAIQPEVPLENLVAFVEAAEEYGLYS